MTRTEQQPAFGIEVAKEPISQKLADDVISIEVVAEVDQLSEATIFLRNWSGDPNSDSDSKDDAPSALASGRPIAISLSGGAALQPAFGGQIVSCRLRYKTGEPPLLEVRCRGQRVEPVDSEATPEAKLSFPDDLHSLDLALEPGPDGTHEGHTTIDGDVGLRVGGPVALTGLDLEFDGRLVVSGLHHVLGPGRFQTEVRFGVPAAPPPGSA
jgi:hypothetical protein